MRTENYFWMFRFGKNVYISSKEVTITIMVRALDGTCFERELTVTIINNKEELFLSRLKTLVDWKAAVFYEQNEIEFKVQKKRDKMEVSKEGIC